MIARSDTDLRSKIAAVAIQVAALTTSFQKKGPTTCGTSPHHRFGLLLAVIPGTVGGANVRDKHTRAKIGVVVCKGGVGSIHEQRH